MATPTSARARAGEPAFQINGYYKELLASSGQPEVKDYLRKKVQAAQDVLGAIAQRRDTLLRCAQAIVDRQEDFFRRGEQALRPLRMADVADAVGIHESTVSRAVREKYLQCQRGVYPLGYFFSRGGAGGDMGGAAAKAALGPPHRRGGQGPSPVRPEAVRGPGGGGLGEPERSRLRQGPGRLERRGRVPQGRGGDGAPGPDL